MAIDIEFPLSSMQESLWFLEQISPGTAAYNIPEAWRLTGSVDVQALERSLGNIAYRHETLRTVFTSRDGVPRQIILPGRPLRLAEVNLSVAPDPEAELRSVLMDDARRPFDLQQGPLVRFKLLKLAPEEHVLSVNMHHIISDSWSFGVLINELALLYRAALERQPNPLRELPIQYADFAVWQRDRLQGESLKDLWAYWQKQLNGNSPLLELPADFVRPAHSSFRGVTEFVAWPKEILDRLKEFSRSHGVTLFMTLLAGFKVLIHRWTRQQDITVGSPFAGRERVETEGLIGFFVNAHALRTDLSGNPCFLELLGRVRDVVLCAAAHQELPLDEVVRRLQPERRVNTHSLFQIVFGFQMDQAKAQGFPGLAVKRLELENGASKFDWSLLFTETSNELRMRSEFSTDLFERETVARFLEQFQLVLERALAAPRTRISDFALLSEGERQKLLVEWNSTEREYRRDKRLEQLFEEQVEQKPEAVALVSGKERLSYRELYVRSKSLAQRLVGMGVGPEKLVGICLERTWEMVAGIMGTLQAGGAYVALDPAYPAERLEFMLKDSGAQVLLTQRKLLGSLPVSQAQVLCVEDVDWESYRGGETSARHGDSSALAYVIYTSGSTGKPKGVMLEHRSAVALVSWAREVYEAEELDGVLGATSICFDLSVYELFVTLSCGGKVVMAANGLALAGLESPGEVRLINTVPSVMRELLRLKAVPGSVRVVNLAGEPLSQELVEQIYRETGVQKVYDLYGPTETTTYSTWKLRKSGEKASIGKPLSNEQVYVLDEGRQLVSIGVAGEIYIGGEGLARGYLGREELTRERFVENPFRRGQRMYRTGDRGRWRGDGELEYFGRLDQQVKVRGYRVELGEVESVLAEHAGVQEAVVVAREESSGDKRLVAYVVPKPGVPIQQEELRNFLETKLPCYLVPAQFVQLERMPLTPSGKVDRSVLPSPEEVGDPGTRKSTTPTNDTESGLMGIWKELLACKTIGIHDNFFHLGGHSLLATQLISRIMSTFQIDLPVRVVFEAPTIAALARAIDGAQPNKAPRLRAIPKGISQTTARDLLSRVNDLTDIEVEELLRAPELQHVAS